MKQILMLSGTGMNETGWARVASRFGRVILVQGGLSEHVEVWVRGERTFCGPFHIVSNRHRKLEDLLFAWPAALRMLRSAQPHATDGFYDLVIGTSYHTALKGINLRRKKRAAASVYMIVDHLPNLGNPLIKLHRSIVRQLAYRAAKHSDEVWRISPRIKLAEVNPRCFEVGVCIDENPTPATGRTDVAYVGFPTPDHCLEILFDICKRHKLRPQIMGDSSHLPAIKALAPADTIFHGVVTDRQRINNVLQKCFCGYAVYRDTSPTGYSYYGFPSKLFNYLSSNVPVVTTNTAHFNQNVEKYGVGFVVEPQLAAIEQAILRMRDDYPRFHEAINRFRRDWNQKIEAFFQERLSTLLNIPSR